MEEASGSGTGGKAEDGAVAGPRPSGNERKKRRKDRERRDRDKGKEKEKEKPVRERDREEEEGEVVEVDRDGQKINGASSGRENVKKKEKANAKPVDEVQMGDDFIPFTFESEEEKDEEVDEEQSRPDGRDAKYSQLGVGDPKRYTERDKERDREQPSSSRGKGKEREWDAGKDSYWDREPDRDNRDRDRDRGRNGRYDPNDGYSSKKERMDAASRKAPWLADIDWEGCTNVAQL